MYNDFNPYKKPGNRFSLKPLRYWCHKILPLVYDDSLSYYELLCRVVAKLNETIEFTNAYYDNFGIQIADPMLWDITKQYEQWTIVLDDNGTAYISKQDVPRGVPLTNTDYWTSIFNFGEVIEEIKKYAFPRPNSDLYAVGLRNAVSDVSQHNSNSFNIIHTRTDKVIICDCGWEYSRTVCENIFNLYGIERCNALVISHFHADHVGNLQNILDLLDCSEMVAYLPAAPSVQWVDGVFLNRYNSIVSLLQANGVEIVTISDNLFVVDHDTSLRFYNSNNDEYYLNLGTDTNMYNNTSRVCVVRTAGNDVMITADLEETGFEKFYDQAVRADLMQIPHHGYGRSYALKTFNRIMPGALFVNNGDSTIPDDENRIPRPFNNIYIQAQKNGKPVYAVSDGANNDLHIVVSGSGVACDTKNCDIYKFHYGRSEYETITQQTGLAAGSINSMTRDEIIEHMETGSKSNGIWGDANGFFPVANQLYRIIKSNTGANVGSYGDSFATLIEMTGRSNGKNAQLMRYKNVDTGTESNHIQNLSIGNMYRMRFNNVAAGTTKDDGELLTITHGSDCELVDGVVKFHGNPSIFCSLLVCEIVFDTGHYPSVNEVVRFEIGDAGIDIGMNTATKRHYVAVVLTNEQKGDVKVINNTTGDIYAMFVNLFPIYYTSPVHF